MNCGAKVDEAEIYFRAIERERNKNTSKEKIVINKTLK